VRSNPYNSFGDGIAQKRYAANSFQSCLPHFFISALFSCGMALETERRSHALGLPHTRVHPQPARDGRSALPQPAFPVRL
jgi:hypothetical protein